MAPHLSCVEVFSDPFLAGALRGNTIRGNSARNSEENGTLRGALSGPLKTSETSDKL